MAEKRKGKGVMFQTLKKMFGGKKEAAEVLSPVSGSVVPLSEVNDPAFAQAVQGFDTGHAVSIRGDNGAEVIVHIGLDTVQLKGQYFTAHVKQGDRVQAGDLLITADLEQIRAAGYDVITPVLICNTPDFPDMVCHTGMQVKPADPIITL